jgi:formylglycine-generating enzyme required for sulfatase activity
MIAGLIGGLIGLGAFGWPGWLLDRNAVDPGSEDAAIPSSTADVRTPRTPSWGDVLEQRPDPRLIRDPDVRHRMEATGLPWRVKDEDDIEYVLVPPGTYQRGSPISEAGAHADERPQHQVTLTRPFYLGRYEVTQAQWTAVMGSNPSRCSDPGPDGDQSRLPVENVSYIMIAGEDGLGGEHTFLGETGCRLPTEAEWEYACRAGTTTPFSFGVTLSTYQANYDCRFLNANGSEGRGRMQTTPAGIYPGNPWGLHDMHGNVWEWCADWYDETAYATCSDGVTDPKGPPLGSSRMVRGGGWSYAPTMHRSAYRDFTPPSLADDHLGFRVARDP